MCCPIYRRHFRVDMLIPAIQTAAAFTTAQILGYLNKHVIRNQTVVLVSGVAALVSSFASNFFKNAYCYYASLPIGIGVGIAAHSFFYPSIPINSVLDAKGVLILTIVLAAVKLISDNLYCLRREIRELEKEVLENEEKALNKVENILDHERARIQNEENKLS
jgi:hypothetical protein